MTPPTTAERIATHLARVEARLAEVRRLSEETRAFLARMESLRTTPC